MPGGQFTFPTILESTAIHYDSYGVAVITTANIKVYFTGIIRMWITANGGVKWDEVTGLISGIFKTHTFESPGAYVGYYILGEGGFSTVYAKLDANGNFLDPAITIEMT